MNESPTLAIIGTGMIGCSFAAALVQNNPQLFKKKLGYSAGKSSKKAQQLGYIDEIASIEEIFARADVILLATPLRIIEEIIRNAPAPKPHQLIIDAGSVKHSVLQTANDTWKEHARHFVPCHPIAGLEKSGPEVADATLYKNKRVIITPDANTCEKKIAQATSLWQTCQAEIHYMEASKHDEILSKASHLPHLLAFALVAGQYQRDGQSCFEWSAGGLRDFTRLASSDPTMWSDITLSNPVEINKALSDYIKDLTHLQYLIEQQDGETLKSIFQSSKNARESFYNPDRNS